ncbi:MAG TPA: glucan biosynthesis protein D [Steroidobacteraceae bacterium]|nr:glucan biosynthesis protein D [Steroidobacteraceae bacterium]
MAMRRRDFLHSAIALSALSSARLPAAAAPTATGDGPFGYASLKGQARALAGAEYRPPQKLAPDFLRALTYDQYQAIRFRHDHALWAQAQSDFRLEFFHCGRGFKEPVAMHEIVDGEARPIRYRPDMFEFADSGIDTRKLPADLSFAGFRVHTSTNWDEDVAVFLGASYFRARGSDSRQFGLSARGLAIDTAEDVEEFPRFVAFWLERPAPGARTLVLYGLLDSASAAGAYRFALTPGAPQVIEVDAAVYPRKPIKRLGIAPLTSMYQCGENDRRLANDWRPEIHDSDGLAICTGKGEWIWRPLTNPGALRFSSYLDENPRGFGLLQRDRNFEHYQDDGVWYNNRPSAWIETKGTWPEGAIQLVELTAPNETFDNIVAFWNPAAPPQPGDELLYGYRMYWGTRMPAAVPPLAQTVATRTGLGGVVGHTRRYFSWRFAVDFAGAELAALAKSTEVEPVVTVSRGTIETPSARPLQSVGGFRAMFDLKPPDDSVQPIDIRLFLRHRQRPLTETWFYQWTPPSPQERQTALALTSTGEPS